MFLKHQYSDNHKVVEDSPHNFCNGGGAMADGGTVEQPTYLGALKDRVGEIVDKVKGAITPSSNPVASGNKDEPYEGVGGADRKKAIDKAVEDAGG